MLKSLLEQLFELLQIPGPDLIVECASPREVARLKQQWKGEADSEEILCDERCFLSVQEFYRNINKILVPDSNSRDNIAINLQQLYLNIQGIPESSLEEVLTPRQIQLIRTMDEISKKVGWTFSNLICGSWVLVILPLAFKSEINLPPFFDGSVCQYEFPDGYKLFYIDDCRIPEVIISNPENITIEDIADEFDVSLMRIMIILYGVPRYLQETGVQVVDAGYSHLDKSGFRCLVEDNTSGRWLVASDGSTNRVYHMAVAPWVENCSEAHVSICGFDERRLIAEA